MVKRKLPSQERARELFDYDPNSGVLSWRIDRHGPKAGDEAGTDHRGYRRVSVDRSLVLSHLVIWVWWYGSEPKATIDHKDGDPSNNRIRNLRERNMSGQAQNRKLASNNTSGFTGVSRAKHNNTNPWTAHIKLNGRKKFLGGFKSAEEAAAAYAAAKKIYHADHPEVVDR